MYQVRSDGYTPHRGTSGRCVRIISFRWCLLLSILIHPSSYALAQAPAIDAREGLPIVPSEDARRVVRRTAVVFGKVVDVGGTNTIQFLNFSQADRSAFKVVIFAPSWPNFPAPLRELYLNKLVEVQGAVTLFDGNPQIVVSRPEQIRIVESFPKSWLPKRPKVNVGQEVTIATFNILNLFDAVDDPYTSDEGTPEKPRAELEAIAETIRSVNADVLALQEVENIGYLRRFVDVFLSEMGYQHVVLVEGNDQRGIDVALVSRLPLGSVTSYRHLRFPRSPVAGTDRFQRDLLCVEVLPKQGLPFEVWVVHLKSKGGGEESDPIRISEARQIRKIVESRLARDPDLSFVICGDFNDEITSVSLQTIVGSEPPQLAALFDDIPASGRITYNEEPFRSMIDFVLCSPAMKRRHIDGSYQINAGTIQSSGSDHNPVSSRFRLGLGEGLAAKSSAPVEMISDTKGKAEEASEVRSAKRREQPSASHSGPAFISSWWLGVGGLLLGLLGGFVLAKAFSPLALS